MSYVISKNFKVNDLIFSIYFTESNL